MARLPRRSALPPGTAGPGKPDGTERIPGPGRGRAAPAFDPGSIVGRGGVRDDRPPLAPGEDVPFDAAVDAVLAAGGIDAVTRLSLSEAQRAVAGGGAEQGAEGLEGANLSHTLFRFVMPRLRHPEVLRAERHRTLLEGLADGLAGQPDDGIALAGARVIHRELHRLALLRTARNALVQD
ncbi:hypothetical protein [Methylobacterium sp. J-076]|uniref:hypothetical protein n=1 Tax=Methylobacterium sp. J-076 TaxID=2836655 RepID=UPI001FBA27C2|nr:hypothetical protein [Methylobacterium sp. J-076]MCJ2013120.1 hypothetical protein [Methylobacterium sp. J-076]